MRLSAETVGDHRGSREAYKRDSQMPHPLITSPLSPPLSSPLFDLRPIVNGQQRRIPAIEGKTPGSKPRDLSMSWAFASCVLEGYERQSPGDSSKLPGYLDSSLLPERRKKKHSIYTTTHIRFLSNPPQQRYYTAREFQQWRQDTCV